MPLVSVLTPTQVHNADHIGETWASIAAQVLPAGRELEWVVQEDGAQPGVRDLLPDDPRIRHDALGVQAGGPAARNHGLARCRGDVVAGLDHDDTYVPGGLAALLRPLVERPEVAWTCGRVRWEMEDGGEWTKDDVHDEGPIPPRTLTDRFLATDDFPFPAAMAVYRRPVLVAHGGWPAVVRSTDAVLLAALSDRWPGWWVARTVAVYRRWSAQKTVQPQDWRIRDLPHVRGVIAQRRAAVDALSSGG